MGKKTRLNESVVEVAEERTVGVKRKTHFEERKMLLIVDMKGRKEFKSKMDSN